MNFEMLREFEKLFGHRWDALVLLCLAALGPLRFNQLAAAMNSRADERLADGTLTRSLHRLEGKRHLDASVDDGHKLYTLTGRGRREAARLDAILSVLDEHHGPNDQSSGNAAAQ